MLIMGKFIKLLMERGFVVIAIKNVRNVYIEMIKLNIALNVKKTTSIISMPSRK